MKNEKKKGNLEIALEYISDDDSIGGNEFKTTSKLISLMPNGISVEKVNQNKKNNNYLYKKNTRMSSNNEDMDSENDNEKKSTNNNQLTDNDNNDNNDNIKYPINNNFNNSENNLILIGNKKKYLFHINNHDSNNSLNKFDKLNNSENHQITYFNDDNEKNSQNKKSSFSPIKKRRKIILEEKTKNRGFRRNSIYAIEHKGEKKEEIEDKKYRKDKNGTIICKKNKKKVKIGFGEPFVKIIPIESFKNYNVMANIPKGEKYIDSKDNCECCLIF